MNSGDCFVLDTEEAIWQWNGSDTNAHEKAKANEFCNLLQADRGGKVEVKLLDEGSAEGNGEPVGEYKDHGFWKHLPGERRFLGIKYRTSRSRMRRVVVTTMPFRSSMYLPYSNDGRPEVHLAQGERQAAHQR